MSGFLFSEGLKEKIGKKKVKKSIYYVIYRGASNTQLSSISLKIFISLSQAKNTFSKSTKETLKKGVKLCSKLALNNNNI